MKTIRLLKKRTIRSWLYLSVYSGFYRRNRVMYNLHGFKKKRLTKKERVIYRDYWRRLSPLISFETVEISKSLSGVFNKKIIPEEFLPLYLERQLNNDKHVGFLENKSIYNKWFGTGVFPKDFFHKIDNSYFTYNLDTIENIEEFIDNNIDETDFPVVIKPNKDSRGGKNVFFVNSKQQIKEVIKQYDHLVVQEKIVQSDKLNAFNKDSINTTRVCLYKDVNGIVHLLSASIRMGKDGSLDNLSDGGIVCNINPSGVLHDYAIDKYAKKYLQHPNSQFVFDQAEFPQYQNLVELSKSIAKNIIGARLISIDMALDSAEQWRCIEVNLIGQTMRFAQYAGKPFLGEFTDEVINELSKLPL